MQDYISYLKENDDNINIIFIDYMDLRYEELKEYHALYSYVAKKTSLKFSSPDKKAYVNAFPRQALHATTLGFVHPRSGEKLSFSSEFPADMAELIEVLNR